MKKILLLSLLCLFTATRINAQGKPNFTKQSIVYNFDREDALANKVDYTTFYIYSYAGTKSGWNAKANAYYPVEKSIIYSKIYRLTNVPVPQVYRPTETSNVCDGLAKEFLKYMIKEYGFSEDLNYATYIGDYDLNFVEKKVRKKWKD